MSDSWMDDPLLRGIDRRKLTMLRSLAEDGRGLSQKELLPFLMAAASQSKKNGVSFTAEETDAIIRVLKIGKSPAEIARIEKLRGMMNTFLAKR